MARTSATRLLAELAGRPALHALLAFSGAAAALAVQGAQLARCPRPAPGTACSSIHPMLQRSCSHVHDIAVMLVFLAGTTYIYPLN